ncbi:MAG: RNA methyltransferase [Bacteroidetes bacterium]|nr:MAG: RNA methyltransferase [Bacteroidota bacterium]REK05835.1 MAG: RNA methyltransferase [Bacteroidota bacterium]REK32029.1 MAG: RNA methyltransferase [Bacteroidota bacterium]REK50093.1 MAG: RNA methyltransferase [Bacteroidota bacterium]
MAYDEVLAERVRKIMKRKRGVEEKSMMGGLTFMLNNKMCCGVAGDDLMVRVVEDKYELSLAKPHCREMDFTGRPLKGFLFVSSKGLSKDEKLREWIELGVEFVKKSPAKAKKKSTVKKKTRKK